nr:MAG TPA: hypothetical protein [Caudoviricetes sp.]
MTFLSIRTKKWDKNTISVFVRGTKRRDKNIYTTYIYFMFLSQ